MRVKHTGLPTNLQSLGIRDFVHRASRDGALPPQLQKYGQPLRHVAQGRRQHSGCSMQVSLCSVTVDLVVRLGDFVVAMSLLVFGTRQTQTKFLTETEMGNETSGCVLEHGTKSIGGTAPHTGAMAERVWAKSAHCDAGQEARLRTHYAVLALPRQVMMGRISVRVCTARCVTRVHCVQVMCRETFFESTSPLDESCTSIATERVEVCAMAGATALIGTDRSRAG